MQSIKLRVYPKQRNDFIKNGPSRRLAFVSSTVFCYLDGRVSKKALKVFNKKNSTVITTVFVLNCIGSRNKEVLGDKLIGKQKIIMVTQDILRKITLSN